jgi:hypothetical protein
MGGVLYTLQTNQREQAQEHRTAAMSLYREMDMRFRLEQAETEMKECP